MEWYEEAFGDLYPILYRHRNDDEARRMVKSFGDLFEGRQPVLDLACGAGRYMTAMESNGVRTWGIDLSEPLLAEAVDKRELTGRLVRGDMRWLPFVDGALGGVMSMFTSFGYFDSDADNGAVIGEVARILRPGGIFLLDFINAGRVKAAPPETTRRESAGYTIKEARSLAGGGRFVVKDVTVTNPAENFHARFCEQLRLYTRTELVQMIEDAGMRVKAMHGDYDRGEYDPIESDRMIVVSER